MRRIEISPDVVCKKVGDELVLLDFEKGVYYGLDQVGAALWESLSGGKTLDEATSALLDEYDVDRAQLTADLEALLAELRVNGLITIEEE